MNLKKGDLVISKVTLKDDPDFTYSILLFVEIGNDGGIAFILNKPLDITIDELIDGFNCKNTAFYGGPVQTDTVHFIHKFGGIQDCVEILNGVFWGGNFEEIKLLAQYNRITGSNAKFFVGYSGWTKKQLETDLKNHYRIVGKVKIEELFLENKNTVQSWEKLYLNQMESIDLYHNVNGRFFNIKNECRKLILNNKIKDAIQLIVDVEGFDNNTNLNEVIIISGKFHEIETKKRIGIINSTEEDLLLNQVRNSLLQIIDNL